MCRQVSGVACSGSGRALVRRVNGPGHQESKDVTEREQLKDWNGYYWGIYCGYDVVYWEDIRRGGRGKEK